MKKKYIAVMFVQILFCFYLNAEKIEFNGNKNYTFVERTDLRRYDNNKYIGLTSREVRAFIIPYVKDNQRIYDGNFYLVEKTKNKSVELFDGINESIESVFSMNDNGEVTMITDNGYPSFRSFPTYINKEMDFGDSWDASGIRVVDPLNKGIKTKLPIYVRYTYLKDDVFHGEEVFVLSAKWATRYGNDNIDVDGDKDLLKATGSHNSTMYISKKTGYSIVVRDTVDENFIYPDKTVSFKGTISLFTEYPPEIDEEQIIPLIDRLKNTDGINFEKTNAGLMMTIENLQFKPDSDVLIDGEEKRIKEIAKILQKVPSSTFLIEGHTAKVDDNTNDMELSKQRARKIVLLLAKEGIPLEKMISKGRGSSKPIADNNTEEGRKRNRRVEITILE